MFSKALTVLALAASASAHMTLEYPVPYNNATVSRSPLEPAGFPCQRPSYEISEMNQWNAGDTHEISFLGTAVHGGGSCQFSITTDAEPTEQSQWKVLHSVVGGCPANIEGNFPDVNTPEGLRLSTKFPVTMPKNIPDGRYTFAWTWLNKVGNREFYMNCAPIQVGTGESASTAEAATALASLPDMFVANVPATQCSTTEGQDFEYPDAGVSTEQQAGAAVGSGLSGAGCASMTKMGAGKGQLGEPTGGASAPAATQPAATTAPANSAPAASSAPAYSAAPVASSPAYSAAPVASAPGYSAAPVASASPVPGLFAPGASSAPAPVATKPVASAAPVASSAPAPIAPSTPSSSDCTPCTNDGAVVCIGTDSFGLCNRGCAVAQKLALGMACRDGTIGAAVKRSFPRAHLHKRHGSGLRLI